MSNDERGAAYRERVYCYELYHQVRALTQHSRLAGAPEFVLSGEIDKAGLNAVVEGGKHKPDLVWHVPGQNRNAVVVEVKLASSLTARGIRKDLATLNSFLTGDRSYSRGIYLLYGPCDPERVQDRVVGLAAELGSSQLDRAILMWHPTPGVAPRVLGRLGN
ncbi:hypothetical protein ACFQ3F_22805 [Nocardioides ginsengisoli]|uniref:DUF91 domain-containing protein n=1 Tax=Nocardioides ginsengisoli TaxID=363868 RepID=A0ABW3W6J3_9ACTN